MLIFSTRFQMQDRPWSQMILHAPSSPNRSCSLFNTTITTITIIITASSPVSALPSRRPSMTKDRTVTSVGALLSIAGASGWYAAFESAINGPDLWFEWAVRGPPICMFYRPLPMSEARTTPAITCVRAARELQCQLKSVAEISPHELEPRASSIPRSPFHNCANKIADRFLHIAYRPRPGTAAARVRRSSTAEFSKTSFLVTALAKAPKSMIYRGKGTRATDDIDSSIAISGLYAIFRLELFGPYSFSRKASVEFRLISNGQDNFQPYKSERDAMPTNISGSVDELRAAKHRNAADLRAYLFLIPIAACLLSILFAMESRAFESEIVYLGTIE